MPTNMPKVSVIIPVYNAEAYLRRCLDSAVKQTLRDIELVCVDDGSTDGSRAILEEYASRDERIKVISQKNRGTLMARKVAVAAAAGEWCAFLDPDDRLAPMACEKFVAAGRESCAEVVQCGMKLKACGDINESQLDSIFRYMNRAAWQGQAEEAVSMMFAQRELPWNLIAKAVRSDVCKKAFEGQADVFATKCEDACAMFRILLEAKRMCVIEDSLYEYSVGQGVSTKPMLGREEVIASYGVSAELDSLRRLVEDSFDEGSPVRAAFAKFADTVAENCGIWIMDRMSGPDDRVAAIGELNRCSLNAPVLRAFCRRFNGNPNRIVELMSQACVRLRGAEIIRDDALARLEIANEVISKMRGAKLLAIHIHVFYPEQVPALLKKLSALALGETADVFVTYPESMPALDVAARRFQEVFQSVEIIPLPNIGYDIGPFMEVLRRIDLRDYRFVLKLHTKGRSRDWNLTRLGGRFMTDALWTDTLTDALIGSPAAFDHAVRVLGESRDVGMVAAEPCIVKDNPIRAEVIRKRVNEVLVRLGLSAADEVRFVAGTMFLARAEALKPLASCSQAVFEKSSRTEKDFATAHIYERLLSAVVTAQRLELKGLCVEKRRLEETIVVADRALRWFCKGVEKFIVRMHALLIMMTRFGILRSPCRFDAALVHNSRFFNPVWYSWKYRDVREEGMDPAVHYVTCGWKEGRWPSAFFSPELFLAVNPDVRGRCPVLFFERNGRYENRVIGTGLPHGWTAAIPGYCTLRRMLSLAALLFRLVSTRNIKALKQLIKIRLSRDFNHGWYLRAYEDIRYSFAYPAWHYLVAGWREGRDPSLRFGSEDYVAANPDVGRAKCNPLLHWEMHGRAEGRASGRVEPIKTGLLCLRTRLCCLRDRKIVHRNRKTRILVHLHLFYPELWDAIASYLRNLDPYGYRLVVTYPPRLAGRPVLGRIAAFHDDVVMREYENRGFDVGPFLDYLNEVNLDEWDVVYHIHSKGPASKTKGRFVYGRLFRGDDWFMQLYEGCLGPGNVHRVIDALMHEDKIGLCCADNLVFTDEPAREDLVRLYSRRLGVNVQSGYSFIGGTCFAAKADVLKPVRALGLRIGDFKESCRFIFTFGHAMERVVPIMVENNGYSIRPFPAKANRHLRDARRLDAEKQAKADALLATLAKSGIDNGKVLHLDLVSGLGLKFAEGDVDGHHVFVKVGGSREVAANEVEKMQAMQDVLPGQVPVVRRFDPDEPLVAMDYIPAVNLELLMNVGLTDEERLDIVRQLREMKDRLCASRFLHRDIRPANLVYHGGKLYLLDFQFMVERTPDGGIEELPFVSANPVMASFIGDAYKSPDGTWDDGYSFDKMIEEIEGS